MKTFRELEKERKGLIEEIDKQEKQFLENLLKLELMNIGIEQCNAMLEKVNEKRRNQI